MLYILPLTFILWPFSVGLFNSQLIGLFFLFGLALFNYNKIKLIKISPFLLFLYISYLLILSISVLLSEYRSESLKIIFYVLCIPFLYIISFLYVNIKNINLVRMLYAVVPFLVFCLAELIFPPFHEFVHPYFATESAKFVIENGYSGNIFRNIGWSGFLFADYSVALAFTALGLLFFKKKPNIFSLSIELFCILLSLVAGRSALPVVTIYLILALFFNINILRISLILIAGTFIIIYLINNFGDDFFVWMLEPIYRYIDYGEFVAGSVNETAEQFNEFLKSIEYDFLGVGVYFSSNYSYYGINLVPGDSGLIRMYHASGLAGLLLFIMIWISIFLKIFFSFLCNMKNDAHYKIFALILLGYSFLFFYKSEWLYQKFFIFWVFCLYQKIFGIRKEGVK